MAIKGTPHFPKLQHYWSLIIRLFSVISRTVIARVLASLRSSWCILQPQLTGKFNPFNHNSVQVLNLWKVFLVIFTCSQDWTCNLQMIPLRSSLTKCLYPLCYMSWRTNQSEFLGLINIMLFINTMIYYLLLLCKIFSLAHIAIFYLTFWLLIFILYSSLYLVDSTGHCSPKYPLSITKKAK